MTNKVVLMIIENIIVLMTTFLNIEYNPEIKLQI